jgi:hypothetical protein
MSRRDEKISAFFFRERTERVKKGPKTRLFYFRPFSKKNAEIFSSRRDIFSKRLRKLVHMAHELIQFSYNLLFIVTILYKVHFSKNCRTTVSESWQDSGIFVDSSVEGGSDVRFRRRRDVQRSEYHERAQKIHYADRGATQYIPPSTWIRGSTWIFSESKCALFGDVEKRHNLDFFVLCPLL